MPRRLTIPLVLFALAAAPGAEAQGVQRCESAFRQCAAECGAGPAGACVAACYQDRASCIQNPSRPPQRPAG
jgi:hypothetical protein